MRFENGKESRLEPLGEVDGEVGSVESSLAEGSLGILLPHLSQDRLHLTLGLGVWSDFDCLGASFSPLFHSLGSHPAVPLPVEQGLGPHTFPSPESPIATSTIDGNEMASGAHRHLHQCTVTCPVSVLFLQSSGPVLVGRSL